MEGNTRNLMPVKSAFSFIGFSWCIFFAISFFAQMLILGIAGVAFGDDNWLVTSSWGRWLSSYVPMYLMAFPVLLLLMKQLPVSKPQVNKIGFTKLMVYFFICYFFIYVGGIVGNVLAMFFSGGRAQNTVAEMAMDTNPLKILVMVILAPLVEEFIFRRLLIDRIGRYGEKTAVILSAFAFALLHQNLFQFFYAFLGGLIFAYVYIRSGRLRYSVILHTIINFLGSVVAPWIMRLADLEALANINPTATNEEIVALYLEVLPGLLIYLVYAFVLFSFVIAGIVLLIVNIRKTTWMEAAEQLEKGKVIKTVYLNAGMITYFVLCLVFFVISLIG